MSKTMTIRVPEALIEALDREAARRGTTRNALARDALAALLRDPDAVAEAAERFHRARLRKRLRTENELLAEYRRQQATQRSALGVSWLTLRAPQHAAADEEAG